MYFFSNRIEDLAYKLQEQLFTNSSPFVQRMVYLSCPMMRSWLINRFTAGAGICMGVEFSFHRYLLTDLLRIGQIPYQLPSVLELSLAIESHINQFFEEGDKEIHNLLGDNKGGKFQRKLTLLSHELASLFHLYGTYGSSLIDDWKNESAPDWQQKLWEKLFEGEDAIWTYPLKLIEKVDRITSQRPLELHFFGLSYIPPIHYHFLSSIDVDFPITSYILSPTQNFWSDLMTDKQIGKIRENNQLEDLLRDRNPLLANMGKLGRRFIQSIEEYDFDSSETYFISDKVAQEPSYQDFIVEGATDKFMGENTLLEYLQADLLLLKTSDEKIDLGIDRSISIHSASSIYREVEILYDNILYAMNEKKLEPEEILVMAPDINLYTSTIRAIFDAKKSPCEYQFFDLEILSQNRLAKGFLHLLDLVDSRWDSIALLELFEHPDFQKGHQLSSDDLFLIKEWIQKTRIAWGEDKSHRQEILKRYHMEGDGDNLSDIGTWKQGIERLLDALAIGDDHLAVEFSQAPLLGRWIGWLQELRHDLKKVEENKTLSEWPLFLKNLLEKYFPQASLDSRSTEEYEIILKMIDKLFCRNSISSNYSWFSIRFRLDQLFMQEGESFPTRNLNAITFCSLKTMRGASAKAIFLLGMNDLAFPRRKKNCPHNLICSEKDFFPTASDEDRYLFLEAIVSARSFLTISYIWDSDNKQKAPSLLVSELLDYLDESYTMNGQMISESILFHHPYNSHSIHYFTEQSVLKSYSEDNYRLAQASLSKKKALLPIKFSVFEIFEEENCFMKEDREISLRQLSSSLRNPIKSYLKESLSIILDKEEENVFHDDEPFLLNRLDLHFWKKELLNKSTDEILSKATKEGKFPSGIFGKHAYEMLESCRQEQLQALEAMNIEADKIGTLFFDKYALRDNSKDLVMDPISLEMDGFKVRLNGKIEGISPQGLILDSYCDPTSIMKEWANIHIFHRFCEALKIEPKVHFLRDQETWILEKPDQNKIEQIVWYFLMTEKHLVLYLPEWIDGWQKESSKALNDLMKKSLTDPHTPFYNREAKWLWRDRPPPQITEEQFECGASFVRDFLLLPNQK